MRALRKRAVQEGALLEEERVVRTEQLRQKLLDIVPLVVARLGGPGPGARFAEMAVVGLPRPLTQSEEAARVAATRFLTNLSADQLSRLPGVMTEAQMKSIIGFANALLGRNEV